MEIDGWLDIIQVYFPSVILVRIQELQFLYQITAKCKNLNPSEHSIKRNRSVLHVNVIDAEEVMCISTGLISDILDILTRMH